ncbi:uncharacterized protein LOC144475487 [Augochlora pura]
MGVKDKCLPLFKSLRESKRGCCAHAYTFADTWEDDGRHEFRGGSQKQGCDLRKCKYAKLQAENTFCNTQKLLDKIQKLKRSIQDLESSQSQNRNEKYRKKDVLSQTNDLTVTDLNSARQVLNNCMAQIGKLKDFLDDENCWWRLFKKMDFSCCEQKAPHLHGHLDGTMITLKLMDEGKQFVTSTPRSSEPKVHARVKDESMRHYTDDDFDETIKFKDMSERPRMSTQFVSSQSNDSCQKLCPVSCASHNQTKKDEAAEKTDFERRRSNSYEPFIRRLSSSVKIPPELKVERSSTEIRKRPRSTFSSENAPTKKIMKIDTSTSMDLMEVLPTLSRPKFNLNLSEMPKKNMRSFMVRAFPSRPSKTPKPRGQRSESSEMHFDMPD